MLSPDGNKRSSIRLTLKTSNLVTQQQQQPAAQTSPEVTSPVLPRPRHHHHHNTRRSTASISMSDEDFKFCVPPMPEHLGYWEEVLLAKFAKLRKLKGSEVTTSSTAEEATVESSPVQAPASSSSEPIPESITSPTGETAREHAIKLVLSGHLHFESQSDSSRQKCVSRKRSSVVSRSYQASDLMSPTCADEPFEGFLKPVEPEVFSPTVPVKIKLPPAQHAAAAPPGAIESESPKAELRKQVFVRGWRLTKEAAGKIFRNMPGYVSLSFQPDRTSAVVDFDSHANALSAVKAARSASVEGVGDLFVCLTRHTGGDATPFEASQFESSLAEQVISSPTSVEEDELQQQWNSAQRRVTIAASSSTAPATTTVVNPAALKSPTTESTPSMAQRELQTYEDVF